MANTNLQQRAHEIEQLVLKAQKGDQGAFSAVYDLFVDPIFRYVYYRVGAGDVEDVVENVFLKVWENLRQYRPKRSFSAWIFRIAHNLVVDYYRSGREREVLGLDPQIPDDSRLHNPIKNTQNVLDNEVLRRAVAMLKKQYRDVVIYKFINEFSNEEIAEIMQKSEGSLRILQFRALKALKRELLNLGFTVT